MMAYKGKELKWKTVKVIGITIIVIISIIIAGCTAWSIQKNEKDKEIAEKASKVAIEFLIERESVNLVVDDFEFTSAIGGGIIFIYGHDKDKPTEELTVTVSYYYEEDFYEVGGVEHNGYLSEDNGDEKRE